MIMMDKLDIFGTTYNIMENVGQIEPIDMEFKTIEVNHNTVSDAVKNSFARVEVHLRNVALQAYHDDSQFKTFVDSQNNE